MSLLSIFTNFFKENKPSNGPVIHPIPTKKPKTKITAQKNDPMYYFQLARQQFETDQPFERAMIKYHEMKLESLKSADIAKTKIICVDTKCTQCADLDKKIFRITDAIKLHPLPCAWCKNEYNEKLKRGWCRCMYYAHF